MAIKNCHVVILSDYAKGSIVDPQAFIKIAKDNNIPVVIDPKRDDFSVYRNASVITPNLKELQKVVGPCFNERNIVNKGRALVQTNNFAAVIVTRG